MFKIAIEYALRNIIRTPLRSFFTIFSIAMIISMYTLLTMIANSFTDQLTQTMKAGDVDIIIQSKFSATPLSSSVSHAVSDKIASVPNVKTLHEIVVGKKRLADKSIVFVFGISDFHTTAGKLGLSLVEGRLYRKNRHELIMAQKLMEVKKLHIGETLLLSEGKPYTISGNYNSWISFFNSSIMLDIDEARVLLNRPDKTNMLFLTLQNPAQANETLRYINQTYPSVSAVKSSDFSGTLGALKNMFYLSDIIAVIALLVASAILINTFLMAVHERKKEIGILNAVGWTKGMILSIFTTEALMLSLSGGLIGFFISWGMLAWIRHAYGNISFYLPQSMDLKLFASSMLMCLLIGVVSAIIPALYATRISVAKALRDG